MTYAEPFLPACFEKMSDEDMFRNLLTEGKIWFFRHGHAVTWALQSYIPKRADSDPTSAHIAQASPDFEHKNVWMRAWPMANRLL